MEDLDCYWVFRLRHLEPLRFLLHTCPNELVVDRANSEFDVLEKVLFVAFTLVNPGVGDFLSRWDIQRFRFVRGGEDHIEISSSVVLGQQRPRNSKQALLIHWRNRSESSASKIGSPLFADI